MKCLPWGIGTAAAKVVRTRWENYLNNTRLSEQHQVGDIVVHTSSMQWHHPGLPKWAKVLSLFRGVQGAHDGGIHVPKCIDILLAI